MTKTRNVILAPKLLLTTLFGLLCLTEMSVYALDDSESQSNSPTRQVVIRGRKEAVVTTAEIRLSDIAEIRGTDSRSDEAVIALQKIILRSSPAPGATVALAAQDVVSRLQDSGVDLQQVGYVFPKRIEVKRAARPVLEQEIRSAIESFLGITGRQAAVKQITFPQEFQVSPDEVNFEATQLATTTPGHIDFQIRVKGKNQPEASFQARALIDEWRETPIARRPLSRGAVVSPGDVLMARLNIASIPKDAADSEGDVMGLKLGEDLASGEIFRRTKLIVPPMVNSGSRVTMRYKTPLFEATATGEALESGAQGQTVKVKNLNSKRVVFGTVVNEGIVEVKP